MKKTIWFLLIGSVIFSCKKDPPVNPSISHLVFKFKFDSTQVRLNGFGQPASMPAGHQALSPKFNKMSAHYIELAQNEFTALGKGSVLYKAPEVTTGITTGTYTTAIDFAKAVKAGDGEQFYVKPLAAITAGTYNWLRISLAYQNYDIQYKYTYMGTPYIFSGTIASFIGYSTYINSYTIKTEDVAVNTNKLQGYWGFETSPFGSALPPTTGQAPPGATTVVNPLASTSPIPPGSCVVTAQFVDASGNAKPLVITGTETSDIVIEVSLSTNKSFEWAEHSSDAYFEPLAGDTVVDMGIRGMIPFIQ